MKYTLYVYRRKGYFDNISSFTERPVVSALETAGLLTYLTKCQSVCVHDRLLGALDPTYSIYTFKFPRKQKTEILKALLAVQTTPEFCKDYVFSTYKCENMGV